MPRFPLKLDSRNRVTIPDAIANSIGTEVFLSPNTVTALLHRKDLPTEEIIKSTELLLQMLRHDLELEIKQAELEKQKKLVTKLQDRKA